jgi:U4/U6.U5 tri-snRNP-associated protein 1
MGTQSEQTYGTGMASTLAILRQQGILKGSVEEILDREKTQKEKDRWLAKHRALQARLEQDKLNSRMNRDGPAREYDNRRREQEEQRRLADSFKDYKPDVNIVYYDDNGRALSTKEAWKALSHVFHGKGSGRAKTEKLLKKIEDEQKKEAMVSGDTPLSMIKAFQTRQEKVGQAHMVLSVGNRG